MIKSLKSLKAFKKELISLLILTGFVYLGGLILHLFIVYGITGGLHTTPIFPQASLISLLTVTLFWIVAGPVTLRKNFMLAVSMSTTRRNYILTELCQTGLCSLILYAVCFLLYRLEDVILIPLFYPDFPRETELSFFTALFGSASSGIFWALAFAGVALGIRLLLGSLLIRLGQLLFWIIWGVWMCAFIFISSLNNKVIASIEQAVDYAAGLLNGHLIPLLCCTAGLIIACIGVCLLKRQEVRCI